ncbi:hypothetical protein K491DRAFT_579549, partial [Lophiostoma macrostomum CBS 122681]
DQADPGHCVSGDTALDFGPPADFVFAADSTKHFYFNFGMPRRSWQRHDGAGGGLPCTVVCTDYKVRGRMWERVAVLLRGTTMMQACGQAYVILAYGAPGEGAGECIIVYAVPENMVAAERRLEELNEATIRDAE